MPCPVSLNRRSLIAGLAAGLVLPAGPAWADTPMPLNSGPVMGVLSATGSSPVFSTVANQAAIVVIGMSRLAMGSSPALMRSSNGGSTWTRVAMTSPGPDFVPQSDSYFALLANSFFSVSLLDTGAAQYRIDVTLTGGSVFFLVQNGYPGLFINGMFQSCLLIEPGDANGRMLSLTTTQLLIYIACVVRH